MTCQNVIPMNNFESLEMCSEKAAVVLTFQGNADKATFALCMACVPMVKNVQSALCGREMVGGISA